MEVILIPAYRPDERLITLTEELSRAGYAVLVVDDGSGENYRSIFEAVSTQATVLTQPQNTGKGEALKRGIRELPELFPQCTHFITADADGQHTVKDILRLAQLSCKDNEMILTVRTLDKDIPTLSKLGNDLSRFVFTLLTGRYFKDNQSGLRRFPIAHRDYLLRVKGSKYDYEMNMLYYAVCMGIHIRTMPIETVYIGNNCSSHFDPVKDTFRIYRRLFATAMGSCLTMVLGFAALVVLWCIFGYRFACLPVMAVGTAATLLADLYRRLVPFRRLRLKTLDMVGRSLFRYAVYTLFSFVVYLLCPCLPFWVSFLAAGLASVPLRMWYGKRYGKRE